MRLRPTHRVLLTLALGWFIASLAANTSFAEEPRRSYSFKLGYWIPSEALFREVLGSGLALGGAFSLPLRSNRWIDFQIGYWKQSGDMDPLDYETLPGAYTYRTSEVRLMPLSLSLRVEGQPWGRTRPFILGGVDLNAIREEVDFRQTHPTEPEQRGTNTISNAFLGLHFGGGAEIDIRPGNSLFLEGRLSIVNADTEGVGGIVADGVSIGGIGIFAGFRFK
jgi:hypothetical protein